METTVLGNSLFDQIAALARVVQWGPMATLLECAR